MSPTEGVVVRVLVLAFFVVALCLFCVECAYTGMKRAQKAAEYAVRELKESFKKGKADEE